MQPVLYAADEHLSSKLDQEDARLGLYPADDGCHIYVIDHSGGRLGEYEDASKMEKYRVLQKACDQRPDSLCSFLKRSKLGRCNGKEWVRPEGETTQCLKEEKAQASAIPTGSHCDMQSSGQPPHWGFVMYVGLRDFKSGYCTGICCEGPLGKNDGTVNEKCYIQCPAFLNLSVGQWGFP
ncbi:tubulin-folding cofactor B-like [Molossus molossus]|uniref:tubulin-folding cofactor B-like n=1 Tax=Molossus molossus TaxID=27622 RepID=UPI0017467060|nr:tubulin-folding cofactor B-like [Molossus molossus]